MDFQKYLLLVDVYVRACVRTFCIKYVWNPHYADDAHESHN